MTVLQNVIRVAETARPRNALFWLGTTLLVVLVGVYVATGYTSLRAQDEAARAAGQVIVGGLGDPALRDIPQAHAIAIGHWYDDAHYTGEVHWYPFMTPLLVAWYMRVSGEALQPAYRMVSMLLSAAALPAMVVFLARFCGRRALLYLPVCLLLGLYWPNNSNYPAVTSVGPFVVCMVLIGLAFEQIQSPQSTKLLFVAGIAAGFLALWHGASFFTACVGVGLLAAVWVVVQRTNLGRVLLGAAALALGVLLGAAPLFLPQLLRYGSLQQAKEPRLFLNPQMYGDGNNPAGLFRLALLPTGRIALLVVLFLALVAACRDRRAQLRSMPLVVGYVFALAFGHLGFILHSTEYPQLAQLATRILPAPPHTFAWMANTLEMMMSVVGIGLLLDYLLIGASWLAKRWQTARLLLFRSVAFAASLLATYGWLLLHMPEQGVAHIEHVDRSLFRFAQTVSEQVGQQSVYVPSWEGQRAILGLMPFKVVHLHAPLHSNPYVNDERAQVERQLANGAMYSNKFDDLLRRYQIGFVITMPGAQNILARVCGGTIAAQSPQGHLLWQLHPPCHPPAFMPTTTLTPSNRLGLLADQEQPLRIVGIKPGAKTNFVSFPQIPARPNTLTELHFQGTLTGEAVGSCLSPRAEYKAGKKLNGRFEFPIYYPAEHRLELRYWLITPENTTAITPQLNFDPACFAQGQTLIIEQVSVSQEFQSR